MMVFPISIEPDDNGTVLITCPSLPEVTTFAEPGPEVFERARDAIEEALAARLAHWQDVDLPGPEIVTAAFDAGHAVKISLQSSIKVLLFLACKQELITRAELVRRLGWHREQVDRLFRLDHNSRLDQIDAAFRALGKDVDVEIRNAA